MKKIHFILFGIFLSWNSLAAAPNTWLLGWCDKTEQAIREWNIHFADFACLIRYMIDFFLYFAATIALIFVIIWAYQVAFGALSDNKTQWKDTILMALWGLALAALAWVIVKFILENIS